MEAVGPNVVRTYLPAGVKIVKQSGHTLTYGDKVPSERQAKITAIALFCIMCCLPFLFCIDAFRNTQRALWNGVTELKELPPETVKSILLWHQHTTRTIPEEQRIQLGSMHVAGKHTIHKEIAKQIVPTVPLSKLQSVTISPVEMSVRLLISFAYRGLERTQADPQFSGFEPKFIAHALLLAGAQQEYQQCVYEAIGYFISNINALGVHYIQKILMRDIAQYAGERPGVDDPIKDAIAAFNVRLSEYTTGHA